MLVEDYLHEVCLKLPAVRSILKTYGDASLAEYLEEVFQAPETSCHDRSDLVRLVRDMASSIPGDNLGDLAATELARHSVVLTTNHQGVDFFSQSFQGNILHGLHKLSRHGARKPAVVFSCANIPLNASSYPRGLLLYHAASPDDITALPRHLPVFPDRLKRCLVWGAPPLTPEMLARALESADKLAAAGGLPERSLAAVREILDQDYRASIPSAGGGYSEQSMLINCRLYGRLFPLWHPPPEMVNLDLERIVSALLEQDLTRSTSLVHRILFGRRHRERVLEGLDGERGCWHRERLREMLEAGVQARGAGREPGGVGTVFFWGIDPDGRRVSLFLKEDESGEAELVGRDDHGRPWQTSFNPEALTSRLLERRMIPSLFTCFLTIALARGVVCVGGYFQRRYLVRIQQEVVRALQEEGAEPDMIAGVAGVPTDRYLDSMLAVMTKPVPGHLVPAGPVEIIAGGGIDPEELPQILGLTVREAHLAALHETVPDAIAPQNRDPAWKRRIAAELYRLLEGRILIK